MTKPEQPTDAQERSNAAFVWMRECQMELSQVAMCPASSDDTPDKIEWAYTRYVRAVRQFEAAERDRKFVGQAVG